MELQTALETIKEYCASIQTGCTDCRLFWVCGYLRTTEKPPCFWDIEILMKGGVSPWQNGKE